MIGTRWFVMFFKQRLERPIFLILLNSGNLRAVALNEGQKKKPEKLCKIANFYIANIIFAYSSNTYTVTCHKYFSQANRIYSKL